jgi:hypothetical protein
MNARDKLLLGCLSMAALGSGCGRSNNLFLGRVETRVGNHRVVVTDCYRTTVEPPRKVEAAAWRFTPCRDADILIRDEELMVNGRSYGKINPDDSILVDHSLVSVRKLE